MKHQEKVKEFVDSHEMESTPAFRIVDLVAEVGEIASDAAKSSDYGLKQEELEVKKEELGDAFFSLLTLANSLEIDLEDALEQSLEKYEERVNQTGDPGSK